MQHRRLAGLVLTVALFLTGTPTAQAQGIGAEPVAEGLEAPAAFTFAPDGRIFYGERLTGEIRILDPATGSDTLFYTVPDLLIQAERGLLGVAIHPRYPQQPLVYVYATRDLNGSARNQILAIVDEGGVGRRGKIIFTADTLADTEHNGGRTLFGPGGKLYVVIGEGGNEPYAQDLDVTAGKVLRMTDRGAVPPDNPFPGSLVLAYGIRNSYGFAFDPQSRSLWEIENGPTCNDEINLILPGMNYGWGPNWTCSEPPPAPENTNQDGPDPVLPKAWFTPTVAPTGAAFCVECGLPDSEGTLFFGEFNTGRIQRAVLTADRTEIESITNVYTHPGSILSMERGADGALYFSTGTGIYRLIEV
jgi:glucose/arabinose dehydrogenase